VTGDIPLSLPCLGVRGGVRRTPPRLGLRSPVALLILPPFDLAAFAPLDPVGPQLHYPKRRLVRKAPLQQRE
jgi:hypothetical protein